MPTVDHATRNGPCNRCDTHMCLIKLIRRIQLLLVAIFAMGLGLWLASRGEAAIVGPAPVSFDQKDLDKSFNDNKAGCGSSVPMNSRQVPLDEHSRNTDSLDRLKAALPLGQGSSSSSSSTAGGPMGSAAALSMICGAVPIADDAVLGRLPEDHGLSLPDPPGTDLLRPPRVPF